MTKKIFIFLIILPFSTFGTSTIPHILSNNGKKIEVQLLNDPLYNLIENELENNDSFRKRFNSMSCSASSHGYLGFWELRDNKLFLIKALENPCNIDEKNKKNINLPILKSNQPIFVSWFNGKFSYLDSSYNIRYLTFKNGTLVK